MVSAGSRVRMWASDLRYWFVVNAMMLFAAAAIVGALGAGIWAFLHKEDAPNYGELPRSRCVQHVTTMVPMVVGKITTFHPTTHCVEFESCDAWERLGDAVACTKWVAR